MLDLGTGSARDESLTRCLVATRFARRLGLPPEEVAAVLYTSLLEHLGCTAYASGLAAIFGDEVAATRVAFRTDWERPADLLRTFVPEVAAATGRSRPRVLATMFTTGRAINAKAQPATCEVARAAARRLGLPPTVAEGVHSVLTAWNGKGHPPLAGTAIPLCARITQVASVAVLFTFDDDVRTAMAQLADRAGTSLDPELVARFDPGLLDEVGTVDAYEAVLEAEPDPVRRVDDQQLAEVCRTFGDLVDLKSPSLHGHSTAVGDLAGDAAAPDAAARGRTGPDGRVPARPRPGRGVQRGVGQARAADAERAGPDRAASLLHRARSGSDARAWPTWVASPGSTMNAATAAGTTGDCSAAPRPFRPGCWPRPTATAAWWSRVPIERPCRPTRRRGRSGMTPAPADWTPMRSAAVLEAAGHRAGVRRPRPAGLTDRQVEVLRLLASGLSNRQIAARLVVSPRTAERHVQDVYDKIGLSSRAGAALYAMEHGLIEKSG